MNTKSQSRKAWRLKDPHQLEEEKMERKVFERKTIPVFRQQSSRGVGCFMMIAFVLAILAIGYFITVWARELWPLQ